MQGTFVHVEERIFTCISDDDPVPARHDFHRKDEHIKLRDKLIAKYVMNIRMDRPNETEDVEGEINLDKMKHYIAYCKSYVEAEEMRTSAVSGCTGNAVQLLVALREQVQQVEQDDNEKLDTAIVRISEALAKLAPSPVVPNHHVDEVIRSFKFSTMDSVSAGPVDGMSRGELNQEMNKIDKESRNCAPSANTAQKLADMIQTPRSSR